MGIDERSWSDLFDAVRAIQSKDMYKAAEDYLARFARKLVLYKDKLDDNNGGLVHYTSWENLLKMLNVESGEVPVLRMYNYESANDPEEGKITPPEWIELEDEVDEFAKKYSSDGDGYRRTQGGNTYGCSFSSGEVGVEDHLMFWRLYGNNGEGASLKLGVSPGMDPPEGMYKVRYQGKQRDPGEDMLVAKKIRDLLGLGEEVVGSAPAADKMDVGQSVFRTVRQVLDGYLHLTKSVAYEHEREWRMIKVMRPGSDGVEYNVGSDRVVRRYVVKGKIKDLFVSTSAITLGPRVPDDYGAAKGYIERLVRKHEMHRAIAVKKSTKSYR